MKRGIILINLILLSISIYAQDIFKAETINDLKNVQEQTNYKGKIFTINDDVLLRSKLYKRKYVQNTFIIKKEKYDIRLYSYINLFTFKISNAISIRLYI